MEVEPSDTYVPVGVRWFCKYGVKLLPIIFLAVGFVLVSAEIFIDEPIVHGIGFFFVMAALWTALILRCYLWFKAYRLNTDSIEIPIMAGRVEDWLEGSCYLIAFLGAGVFFQEAFSRALFFIPGSWGTYDEYGDFYWTGDTWGSILGLLVSFAICAFIETLLGKNKRHKEKYLHWIQEAAYSGDVKAQYELGKYYEEQCDFANALAWYDIAADSETQPILWNAAEEDEENYEGRECYRDLARKSYESQKWRLDANAKQQMKTLSDEIRQEIFRIRRKPCCIEWVEVAACMGLAFAQFELGLYHESYAVKKDYPRALAWYALAAAQRLELVMDLDLDIDNDELEVYQRSRNQLFAQVQKDEVEKAKTILSEISDSHLLDEDVVHLAMDSLQSQKT